VQKLIEKFSELASLVQFRGGEDKRIKTFLVDFFRHAIAFIFPIALFLPTASPIGINSLKQV
jgi:hypothetical protein